MPSLELHERKIVEMIIKRYNNSNKIAVGGNHNKKMKYVSSGEI